MEKDLDITNRGKVLGVDKTRGRWKSMYHSPKSKWIEDYVLIDTKIKPQYNLNYVYDEASFRDVQWNIYLLLLFRRYGLIEIIDMEYIRNEDRYVFKIRIIDKRLSLEDEDINCLLKEIHDLEKKRFADEFKIIKNSILYSERECISEMFIKTYPNVLEFCAGCNSHNKPVFEDVDRFPLVKRVKIISKLPLNPEPLEKESLVISREGNEIVNKLAQSGVKVFVSEDYLLFDYINNQPDLMQINFYEFRRLLSAKQDFFIGTTCCVVYASDRSEFVKQFAIVEKYLNGIFKVIHVVNNDYVVNKDGKRVSAFVGNNITDRLMEDSYV